MKDTKYPAILSVIVIFWSLSCVTLFPNTARDIPTTSASKTTTLPTVVSATSIPINNFSGYIVYNKGDYIYSINADGTNDTRLATGKSPVWSPNGDTIAFLSDPDGDFNYDIFLMNSDGTNQRPLLSNQKDYVDPRHLDWLSSGNFIIFGALSLRDGDNGYDIFSIDVDSTTLLKIPRKVSDVWSPSWSPDGKQIIFVTTESADDQTGDIFIINVDGTGEKMLTDKGFNDFPAFSPDGELISFMSVKSLDIGSRIYIMNADGTNQSLLSDNTASFPVWSPDGQYIMFTSTNKENISQLFIIGIDGTQLTYLTDGGGGDWKP
ncbi:MAG: Protein TolB [Anaerolineales bacterium]|nr:Protein TolB [Anaerolineales bacterium]